MTISSKSILHGKMTKTQSGVIAIFNRRFPLEKSRYNHGLSTVFYRYT